MFDLAAKQKLNRGYNDGLTRALEIVVTPLLFGLAGRFVDIWLDTRPWFMIGFGAFGVVGVFARVWVGYDREMRAHEQQIMKPARESGEAVATQGGSAGSGGGQS